MECEDHVAAYLLAGKDPGRLALRMLNRDHSYGELQRASGQIARYLLEAGCERGERVLLLADNGLFWAAGYLGAMRAGLVSVPLPAGIAPPELDGIREATEARIALVQASVLARAAPCFAGMNVVTDVRSAPPPLLRTVRALPELEGGAPGWAPGGHSADDLAALMFTSGSTGKPRGAMISHANIIANSESIIEYLRLTERDRMMVVLPFHYCFGASLLHTHLRVGGSLVIDPRFRYPEAVLERTIETECTGFAGVPSHFQILLRSSGIRKKSFPHLRHIQQAGGRLAMRFLAELHEALPGTEIFVMYGQTEATARLSYLPPEYLDSKPDSVGKGIPGVRLRVLSEQGEEVRTGEIGEIVAEGANVARGYWRAPEESAVSFRNGRLYTGDLATVDGDGFVYLVDRAKDFLKCRGERVGCRQIEEKLLECGELLEAAVVGTSDEILGEAVKAFVVGRNGAGDGLPQQVLEFCREHLPPHLVPREVIVTPALPKNSAGKVIKTSLRAL